MRIYFKSLILSLSLFCAACTAQAGDELEMLSSTITKMTANLDCDNSSHCKSIGYGDKPCGGFNSYLPYSTKSTDEALLIEKVNRYNLLDRKRNTENNLLSNCMMLMETPYNCENKKCVLSPSEMSIYPRVTE
jgi:hypothetical protein